MATDEMVSDVLDETIQALTALDLTKLRTLEEQIFALAQYSVGCSTGSLNAITTKRYILERILQNCESHLTMLQRLYGRNTRDQWAH